MNNPTIHFVFVMEYLSSNRGGIKDNSPPQKISRGMLLAHIFQHGISDQITQQILSSRDELTMIVEGRLYDDESAKSIQFLSSLVSVRSLHICLPSKYNSEKLFLLVLMLESLASFNSLLISLYLFARDN